MARFAIFHQVTFGKAARNVAELMTVMLGSLVTGGVAAAADNSPIVKLDRGIYETFHRDNATWDLHVAEALRLGLAPSSSFDRMVKSTSYICAKPGMTFGVEVGIKPGNRQKLVRLLATCAYPDPARKDAALLEAPPWTDTVDVYHTHFFGCEVEPTDRSGTWRVKLDYEGKTLVNESFDVDMHCGIPIS